MFAVNEDLSIFATRGDTVFFTLSASDGGESYLFQPGDLVRLKIFGRKDAGHVVLSKDFPVFSQCDTLEIFLTGADTRLEEVISKPKDYWYEIELNPDTQPRTIIGYDEQGPRVFRLYPEGGDV